GGGRVSARGPRWRRWSARGPRPAARSTRRARRRWRGTHGGAWRSALLAGDEGQPRVVLAREVAPRGVADLLAGDLAQPLHVADLFFEHPRGLGDAVGVGEALRGLHGEGVLGLELGHRELPLLLGGAALLDPRYFLQDDLLGPREVLGFQFRAERHDAAGHQRGVAHGDTRDDPLLVA